MSRWETVEEFTVMRVLQQDINREIDDTQWFALDAVLEQGDTSIIAGILYGRLHTALGGKP